MEFGLIEILAVFTAASINVLMLMIAWLKFKTTLLRVSTEIKHHSDVSIQKLNGMLTYFIHSADRPMWLKAAYVENGKPIFRMIEMNHLYAEAYKVPRNSYIGKTDIEAGWDKVTADRFYENDLKVWATGEPETFTEIVDGKTYRFRKLLLKTPDGKKKGVMGYAVDIHEPGVDTPQKTPTLAAFSE